jgi:Flp pilus assembly protein TadG
VSRGTGPVQRWGCRLRRDTAGGAAVEFALVLPLLLLMVMGIIDFGRALNIHHVVTDASREAARRAVVRDGLEGADKLAAVTAAINIRLASVGLGPVTVQGTPHSSACPASGEWVPPAASATAITVAGCGWAGATNTQARVLIRAPFPFSLLTPVMRLVAPGTGGGPATLRADFSMRNE